MATNFVYDGATIPYTNGGGATIDANTIFRVGQIMAVALVDIAVGDTGTCAIEGVWTVPKVSAAVIAQGESVIWDESVDAFDDNAATPATGDVSGCCVAVEAAGGGVTTIDVKLNVGVGTVA
jgi:predicted RecA/RadA family phage recombinase